MNRKLIKTMILDFVAAVLVYFVAIRLVIDASMWEESERGDIVTLACLILITVSIFTTLSIYTDYKNIINKEE